MQQLTLALPDLAWPYRDVPLPPLHTPGLDTLLHWGQPHATEQNTAALFGNYLWSGSLLQHGLNTLGLPENQAAFWCSPLHQHIGMHSVQIASGAELSIHADEAAAWCHQLSRFFIAEGWHFYPYRDDLWLVTCAQAPQWQAVDILNLGGRIDAHSKPNGPGAAALLQAQTEIQMLLHNHPLNQARQQQGQAPVNGVWCWRDIAGHAQSDTLLATDSDWAATNLPLHAQPHDWAALQRLCTETGTTGKAVVFIDTLSTAVAHGDAQAYADQLHHWDTHWFSPLQQALASGSLKQLNISSQQRNVSIRNPRISPFWRRQPRFQGQWS